MALEDRYPPDQQFGAEAAEDQERADRARHHGDESSVAADVDAKRPRAGSKAEPPEGS